MSLVGFKAKNHPQQKANPEVDDRSLPMKDFLAWHRRFHFTVDAAANETNRKLPRFWTERDDGLAQDWSGERVYCNPPYSNIEPWVAKAGRSEAELVVMLLPANRTEQGWWQDHVEPDRMAGHVKVEFLRGRLRFIHAGQTEVLPNQRPPFGCCLVIWSSQKHLGLDLEQFSEGSEVMVQHRHPVGEVVRQGAVRDAGGIRNLVDFQAGSLHELAEGSMGGEAP